MSLAELWSTSRAQLEGKLVHQIIAFAGTGQLSDGASTASEFREFLGLVPSNYLARYADECLRESFSGSGFALQDVVNQIGKRLGYNVSNGRYRGSSNQVGFDGLWKFSDGHTVVVEVKTTDAYRIDLQKIANYRRELITSNQLTEDQSSILLVVGRQDTGDLEAQTAYPASQIQLCITRQHFRCRLCCIKNSRYLRASFLLVCVPSIPKSLS